MKFCKYHPLETASQYCDNCHTFTCHDCVVDERFSPCGTCYICHKEVECLKTNNTVLPFWRRLQESFKYPLSFDAVLLIVGIAVLSTLASYLPFSLIWQIFLLGALIKYSFRCLEKSSNGELKAPDVSNAYGSGFGLVIQLLLIFVIVSVVIGVLFAYVGPMVTTIVGLILIAALPAMMINFALSERFFEALNPVKALWLMTSIGLPYGLLLAFIMIMSASVSIINQLIGNDLNLLSTVLQSIVGNYYTVVIFHIMGYMIYQFHDELGHEPSYIASKNLNPNKSVLEKNTTHIDILIKEGDYRSAITLFVEIIESYPHEKKLKPRFFELLLASKNTVHLDDFSKNYFDYLELENRKDQIPIAYKRILSAHPKYMPSTAGQRVKLAHICNNKGDGASVIRLLNGLHKTFPNSDKLIEGYTLMADSLDLYPNMQQQAKVCRSFIEKMKKDASAVA